MVAVFYFIFSFYFLFKLAVSKHLHVEQSCRNGISKVNNTTTGRTQRMEAHTHPAVLSSVWSILMPELNLEAQTPQNVHFSFLPCSVTLSIVSSRQCR